MPNRSSDTGASAIRILVADDDSSVRRWLTVVLDDEPDLVVVGDAEDAGEAVECVSATKPDVALIDLRMPGGGEHATREIRRRSPQTRVIALTVHDDRRSVQGMIRAGATGYLVKGGPSKDLADAVRVAASGGSTLSPGVAGDLLSDLAGELRRREREDAEFRIRSSEIRSLLQGQGFVIVFQPIQDLTNGAVVGLEALARFDLDADESPLIWLDQAEALGVRIELELVISRVAFATLDAIDPGIFLAVNLSPAAVASPGLGELLHDVPGHRVVIEVTEHAPVDDYDSLNACLARLRSRGVRLAVDDAGAGFASLHHVIQLSPDFIKLDIGLIRDIDLNPAQQALASALIGFASETGAGIIA